MIRALFIGASGMSAQQLNIDVISNNLANTSTSGFKKSRAEFEDLLYQDKKFPGAVSNSATDARYPTGMQVGLGVTPSSVQKEFLQGDIVNTGNPLDLAIEGEGFFQITQADGTIAYTRDGSFKLNSTGNLVNAEGLLLSPSITIPPDATQVTIGADGTVSVLTQGAVTPANVGQIQLARFVNPAGLLAMGKNLFTESASSGTPTLSTPDLNGMGKLEEGYLESSNVDIVEEMIGLIVGQRAYEANSKSVQTADALLNVVNSLKR